MMTIREYKRAESLEEAWQLNQKRNNRVIGGMIWLKMENINVGTAIDLSGLGLDKIEETAEGFSIGAMVPLRQIELHEGLNAYTEGAVRESVRHIVGVQLRSLATVGGSIYSRFGFSDVLTMFLALNASVELYKGGIVPLSEYAQRYPGAGHRAEGAGSILLSVGAQQPDGFSCADLCRRENSRGLPGRHWCPARQGSAIYPAAQCRRNAGADRCPLCR